MGKYCTRDAGTHHKFLYVQCAKENIQRMRARSLDFLRVHAISADQQGWELARNRRCMDKRRLPRASGMAVT